MNHKDAIRGGATTNTKLAHPRCKNPVIFFYVAQLLLFFSSSFCLLCSLRFASQVFTPRITQQPPLNNLFGTSL